MIEKTKLNIKYSRKTKIRCLIFNVCSQKLGQTSAANVNYLVSKKFFQNLKNEIECYEEVT